NSVFLLISIIKYAALGVALFFLFRYFDVHIAAFFIGLSMVQVVIVLKFLSLLLVDSLNRYVKAPNTEHYSGHLAGKES
ncbi:MAG: hypothetical protein ACE5KK_07785, partial [Candidatus Brocadiales bacterium]